MTGLRIDTLVGFTDTNASLCLECASADDAEDMAPVYIGGENDHCADDTCALCRRTLSTVAGLCLDRAVEETARWQGQP